MDAYYANVHSHIIKQTLKLTHTHMQTPTHGRFACVHIYTRSNACTMCAYIYVNAFIIYLFVKISYT